MVLTTDTNNQGPKTETDRGSNRLFLRRRHAIKEGKREANLHVATITGLTQYAYRPILEHRQTV